MWKWSKNQDMNIRNYSQRQFHQFYYIELIFLFGTVLYSTTNNYLHSTPVKLHQVFCFQLKKSEKKTNKMSKLYNIGFSKSYKALEEQSKNKDWAKLEG